MSFDVVVASDVEVEMPTVVELVVDGSVVLSRVVELILSVVLIGDVDGFVVEEIVEF